MSRVMGAAASDRINLGHDARLAKLDVGTVLCWCYPTNISPGYAPRLFQKGLFGSGTYRAFLIDNASSRLTLEVQRAGVDMGTFADLSAFAAWSLNSWMCVASVWDINAQAADQRLFVGNRVQPADEPSSYTLQRTGDGATTDDSSFDFILGNHQNATSSFVGRMSLYAVSNVSLTKEEIRRWQRDPFAPLRGRVAGPYVLGANGSGLELDPVGVSHGVVTGTSLSADEPFERRRKPRRTGRHGPYILDQRAVPASVVSLGNWSDEAGGTTNVHTHIDDGNPPNDADYVRSPVAPVSEALNVGLSSVQTPDAGTVRVTVRHSTE